MQQIRWVVMTTVVLIGGCGLWPGTEQSGGRSALPQPSLWQQKVAAPAGLPVDQVEVKVKVWPQGVYAAHQLLTEGRGVLAPALQVAPDNSLMPDYPLSLIQQEWLKGRLGLRLAPVGKSILAYRQVLRAVAESCPPHLNRVPASCQVKGWLMLGWSESKGRLSLQQLADIFQQQSYDYAILPGTELYANGMSHARYGVTTKPLTSESSLVRAANLAPWWQQADLVVVKSDSREPVLSCQVVAPSTSLTAQQWQSLNRNLLSLCEPAFTHVLGLPLHSIEPGFATDQKQLLKELLQ